MHEIFVEFLNIEMNNVLMKNRLFLIKLIKIITKIKIMLIKNFILHIQFRFLIKFLFFVVKMIILNKIFLRRLYDVFKSRQSRYHIIVVIRLNLT